MGGDALLKFFVGAISSALIILTGTVVFDSILQLGMMPGPGDPFNPAVELTTDGLTTAMKLAIGTIGAVSAYIIVQLRGL